VWLQVTTKKHIVDKKRLKPGKILLPHTLNRSNTASICLITPDPQRAFKDVLEHPTFPKPLAKQLRILGMSKLKARYKTFESRRQLLSEYDVFLADDRIVEPLPKLLGKVVFEGSKRPVPVRLEGYKPKDPSTGKRIKSTDKKGASSGTAKSVTTPPLFAKEIEKALSSARVHLSPSTSTAVCVGYSNFSGQELADNVEAVVSGMVEKFVTRGWRNMRAIHIKGPNTAALPIWMSDELWVDHDDVIEDAEAEALKQKAIEGSIHKKKSGTKRKQDRELLKEDKANGGEKKDTDTPSKNKKQKRLREEDEGFSREMAERREALRQAKREARETLEKKVDKEISTERS
jgi:ribosome biogenesis protein UTP30